MIRWGKEKISNNSEHSDLPLVTTRKEDKPVPEAEDILFPKLTVVGSVVRIITGAKWRALENLRD